MAQKIERQVEEQAKLWSGIGPPNPASDEFARGLAEAAQRVRENSRAARVRGRAVELRSGTSGNQGAGAMTASAARASALTRLTLVQASEAVAQGRGHLGQLSLRLRSMRSMQGTGRSTPASPSTGKRPWRRPRGSTDCARPGAAAGCACTACRWRTRTCTTGSGKLCTCGSKIRKSFRPTYTATAISDWRMRARSPSARSTWRSSRRTRPATTPTSATATIPGTSTIAPAGPRRAREQRSPPASSTARWGPTPAAPSACPRPCAASPASRARRRASPATAPCRSRSRPTTSDRWRERRATARVCWARSPATIQHDPTSSTEPVPDYEASLDGDIRGLVIGVPANFFFDGVDPEVQKAFDAAMQVLEARGAKTVRLEMPHMDAVNTYASVHVARGGRHHPRAMDARAAAGLFHPSRRRGCMRATPFRRCTIWKPCRGAVRFCAPSARTCSTSATCLPRRPSA